MQTVVSPSPLLAALVRHYDQLVAHVCRHIARFGGDATAAPDVVHDLCLQLLEAPPADTVHTPLAFLRQIATRRAIDRHRGEAGRAAWQLAMDDSCAAALAEPQSLALDPAQLLAGRQQIRRLAAAIERLPPRCRAVFVMHKIHQLPQAEVALRLGVSLKAVEAQLRRGMLACRLAMETA
jgi:RNA polymerase sigma factor (sigma-70 family)